jgi:hypothetical protein
LEKEPDWTAANAEFAKKALMSSVNFIRRLDICEAAGGRFFSIEPLERGVRM